MSAEHLRALIELHAPGRSVRDLTTAAGVPENRLAYWIKPGTALNRMPKMDQVVEIAQIIGCTRIAVYRAFRADVDPGAYLDDDLPEDERALLVAYRRLPDADRRRAIAMMEILGS